jgi:hypothetical protein
MHPRASRCLRTGKGPTFLFRAVTTSAGISGGADFVAIAAIDRFFPSMGWGQPNSAGCYLDLIGAVLGFALLLVCSLGTALRKR